MMTPDERIQSSGIAMGLETAARMLELFSKAQGKIVASDALREAQKEVSELKRLAELGRIDEIISAYRQ